MNAPIETCQDLESALIGAMLVAPNRIVKISDKVKPTDFVNENAMTAYIAIMAEYQKDKTVNIVSVASRHPELSGYLAMATNDAFPPGIVKFAEDIATRAKTRRIKAGLEAMSMSAGDPDSILNEMINLYHHEMAKGAKPADIKNVMQRVDSFISKNRSQGRVGFSTGFDIHENIYYRYLPGHIWTMGGFTSVGKTAVMIQKVCNLLSSGEGAAILIISTEMTEEQVVARIISNFTGIHSMRILSGNYHDAEEENHVANVSTTLKESKLTIYDNIYDLEDIETAFRKAELQGGVDVGVIDYVQNCRWSGAKSEYQEQATMAKRIQSLAKDVKASILCLSQVSNSVGKGDTTQFELKNAGEWAAVSDLGVMLRRHQQEKYGLKYTIAKNRHGKLAESRMDFVNDFTRIEEIGLI